MIPLKYLKVEARRGALSWQYWRAAQLQKRCARLRKDQKVLFALYSELFNHVVELKSEIAYQKWQIAQLSESNE